MHTRYTATDNTMEGPADDDNLLILRYTATDNTMEGPADDDKDRRRRRLQKRVAEQNHRTKAKRLVTPKRLGLKTQGRA